MALITANISISDENEGEQIHQLEAKISVRSLFAET